MSANLEFLALLAQPRFLREIRVVIPNYLEPSHLTIQTLFYVIFLLNLCKANSKIQTAPSMLFETNV